MNFNQEVEMIRNKHKAELTELSQQTFISNLIKVSPISTSIDKSDNKGWGRTNG